MAEQADEHTAPGGAPSAKGDPTRALPTARVRDRRGWTLFWLVPVFAACVAGWLGYRQFIDTGYSIQIRFDDASGLQGGKSQIKFRGVMVGRVTRLALADDRSHTVVHASLSHEFEDLARKGSVFWVVKPQISGTTVRGLSTVASQSYISMQLGRGKAGAHSFDGAPYPPVSEAAMRPQHALRIHLRAPQRWGLERGSTIQYRGADAGWILSYHTERDGAAVDFDVLIKDAYAPFVQNDSKFYRVSAIDVSAGLFKGLNLQVGNLQSLLGGGVAVATPPGGGDRVKDGTTFRLHDQPKDEWKQWSEDVAATTVPEGKY